MALLDAPQYDATRDRRRRNWIIVGILIALVLAWTVYHFRDFSERHAVANFFAAIQKQDFESAYGIWFNDPNWKQHPAEHKQYAFGDFYRDWGPGGEWGLVKSYSVDCSVSPGSGVIVEVTVNERSERAYVWVEKAGRVFSFSPNEVQCGNWFGWLTE